MSTGLRIGRYELGERLGTGGFGVVYHARDTELGRELAIKVLRPEYQTQPDVVARFLKEARAAAKIDHPGIVTVFECGTISGSGTAQDGNAYIAMELLRGFSLTQHLERKRRMSAGDAVLVARQVAQALQVAHAAGIVHRDLKPDNVFLLPDPLVKGGFRIKILDFGVAKLAEPKEVGVNTHSQMMLGTPKYMSPEQARSARAVDARTDVYTLGCMLFEMVTGQAPYEGPGAIDMIIQHTTSPIPSARSLVHGLPDSVDKLIQQMLAKEPDERPASMQAIDKALEAIQAEVVPPSIPPTPMRPKPPTTPPAIPPTPRPPIAYAAGNSARPTPMPPARPTPMPPARPTPPETSGLTPTPEVEMSHLLRPPKPTPAPPPPPPSPVAAVPSSSNSGLPAARPEPRPTPPPPMRPTPLPPPRPSPFVFEPSPDEQPTTPAEPRATMRTRKRGAPVWLLVLLGLLAAAGGAAAVFMLTNKRSSSEPNAAAATDAPRAGDAVKIEQECLEDERGELWRELQECSERLKPHNPKLADRLWKKADDEAAHEKKWLGIQEAIKANDVTAARKLIKRLPETSVYAERAQKLIDGATE